MNNQYWLKKKLHITLLLILISNTILAQYNFKLSGTFTDVKNGTLICEYIIRGQKQKIITEEAPIKDGKFILFAKLENACAATLQVKDRQFYTLSTIFVPNEEAIVYGPISEDYKLTWTGTTFYKQYGKAKDFIRVYENEFSQADQLMYKGIKAGGNVNKLRKQNMEARREINYAKGLAAVKYIREHINEEGTLGIIASANIDSIPKLLSMYPKEISEGRLKKEIALGLEYYNIFVKERNAAYYTKNRIEMSRPALEFNLKGLNGNLVTLNQYKGKFLIIDFWGSWCTWCIKGFSKLKAFYAQHKDQVEIIGVACKDDEKQWRQAVIKYALPWQHVRSEDGIAEQIYKVYGYPYKVIIDKNGTVIKSFAGNDKEFYTYMDKLLKK